MKNKEILWEQSLDTSLASLFMGMEIVFVVFMISYTLLNMFKWYKSGISLDHYFFIPVIEIGLYGGIFLYTKVNQLVKASTLRYQIKNDSIVYKWGLRKNKAVEIPFTEITAINLVKNMNKDHFTINLITKHNYPLKKANSNIYYSRHSYSLKKVKKGNAVFQLLTKQWKAAAA